MQWSQFPNTALLAPWDASATFILDESLLYQLCYRKSVFPGLFVTDCSLWLWLAIRCFYLNKQISSPSFSLNCDFRIGPSGSKTATRISKYFLTFCPGCFFTFMPDECQQHVYYLCCSKVSHRKVWSAIFKVEVLMYRYVKGTVCISEFFFSFFSPFPMSFDAAFWSICWQEYVERE